LESVIVTSCSPLASTLSKAEKSAAKPEISGSAERSSENTTSSASRVPYSPWQSTSSRSENVQTRPSSEVVQLSAISGSTNSGLALPGWMRTSPLNIQCSSPLSGVVVATCGSSLPASALAMPTFSVVCSACAEVTPNPTVESPTAASASRSAGARGRVVGVGVLIGSSFSCFGAALGRRDVLVRVR